MSLTLTVVKPIPDLRFSLYFQLSFERETLSGCLPLMTQASLSLNTNCARRMPAIYSLMLSGKSAHNVASDLTFRQEIVFQRD